MSIPVSKYLYQNVIWKGLYYVASFLLNILIARQFKADVSGSIYYLISIFAFVHLLLSISLESGLIFFGAKKQMDHGKLLIISMIWTFLAALFLLFFTLFLRLDYPNIDKELFVNSILFFVIGNMLSSYGTALFYSQNNFVIPNLINLSVTIILILLLPYNNKSVFSLIDSSNYFYIYFFGFLVQGIVTLTLFPIFSKEKMSFAILRRDEIAKLLRFSLFAWSGNIIFFLLYRIDYWFVEKYCTPLELGNYIQVSKLAQLFFLVPSMFAGAIFPLTAAGNKSVILEWLGITSRFFLFIYSIICLVLVATGHWLFPLIFGESFIYMHTIFILFVPGILSLSTLYTITAFNGGNNRIKQNILGSLFALTIVITLNILLIPKYGAPAAAAICSVGYLSYYIYLLYQLKKSENIRLSSFFILQISDIARFRRQLKSDKSN